MDMYIIWICILYSYVYCMDFFIDNLFGISDDACFDKLFVISDHAFSLKDFEQYSFVSYTVQDHVVLQRLKQQEYHISLPLPLPTQLTA